MKANMFLRMPLFKVSYEPKRVQEVFELVAAAQLISRFYIWGPNGQYVFVKVDSKDAYEVMKSKPSLLKKNRAFPFINCPGRNWLCDCLCWWEHLLQQRIQEIIRWTKSGNFYNW